jgi:hypothetical protein
MAKKCTLVAKQVARTVLRTVLWTTSTTNIVKCIDAATRIGYELQPASGEGPTIAFSRPAAVGLQTTTSASLRRCAVSTGSEYDVLQLLVPKNSPTIAAQRETVTRADSGRVQIVDNAAPASKDSFNWRESSTHVKYVLGKPMSKSVSIQSTIPSVGGTKSESKDRRRHRQLRKAEAVPGNEIWTTAWKTT